MLFRSLPSLLPSFFPSFHPSFHPSFLPSLLPSFFPSFLPLPLIPILVLYRSSFFLIYSNCPFRSLLLFFLLFTQHQAAVRSTVYRQLHSLQRDHPVYRSVTLRLLSSHLLSLLTDEDEGPSGMMYLFFRFVKPLELTHTHTLFLSHHIHHTHTLFLSHHIHHTRTHTLIMYTTQTHSLTH